MQKYLLKNNFRVEEYEPFYLKGYDSMFRYRKDDDGNDVFDFWDEESKNWLLFNFDKFDILGRKASYIPKEETKNIEDLVNKIISFSPTMAFMGVRKGFNLEMNQMTITLSFVATPIMQGTSNVPIDYEFLLDTNEKFSGLRENTLILKEWIGM